MEFAQVLLVLWKRRWWVALGSVIALLIALSTGYHLSFFPPKLTPKALANGSADTQLLVDSPRSSLLNNSADPKPFVDKAAVLAPLMTTEPVRAEIARIAGVPASQIYVSSPLNPDQTIFANEPSAAKRSQQILGQNLGLRLTVQAETGEPTIEVNAQATTARDAVHLANAAASGFIAYLQQSEAAQQIPRGDRTVLRQLGPAEGGTIGGGANIALVAVAFLGALIGWMVLVVIASSVYDNLRTIRAESAQQADESPAG